MNILVVDDNHILTTILADYLKLQGHTVVPAFEGHRASIFCQQRHFDAILIDLVMPDFHGVEVLEELYRQHRMPKAIVITGFEELLEDLSPRLEAVGVDAVIRKPFSFTQVDDALARIQ